MSTNEKLKIMICCHKKCELPADPDGIFLPVQAGATLAKEWYGFQRDDQVNGEPCDNISAKNESFCELTVMYWAWKNIKKLYPDLEYIGVNHYRRYFSFEVKDWLHNEIVKPSGEIKAYQVNTPKLLSILKAGYSIITKPAYFLYPVWVFQALYLPSRDFKTLREVIHRVSPEYDEAFYQVIFKQNYFSPCNMMVLSWENFEAYCTWVFKVLFEAEKQIDTSWYKGDEKRILGYMSEVLFNVWIVKNKIKLKKLNYFKYDDDSKSLRGWIRILLLMRYQVVGMLIKPSPECCMAYNTDMQYSKLYRFFKKFQKLVYNPDR